MNENRASSAHDVPAVKPLIHVTRRDREDPVVHLQPDVTVTVFGNGSLLLEAPGRRAFMQAGATFGDTSSRHGRVWPAGLLVMDAVQRQGNPLVEELSARPVTLDQALSAKAATRRGSWLERS